MSTKHIIDGFQVGSWLVKPGLNTVSQAGWTAHLEPKIMQVLVCLAEQAGEAVSKEQLLRTVWPDTFVSDDVLVRSVSELRRVFEDDARDSRFIQTIPKRGYRLVAPVEVANGAKAAGGLLHRTKPARGAIASRRALGTGLWVGAGAAVLLLAVLGLKPMGIWHTLAPRENVRRIQSIAVLPLKNLSDDPAQNYFANGMTEELITDLSQISALKVISRRSSEVYQDSHEPLRQIASELNVDGIIEGSVQRSGNRVRITAQLIYAPQDKNIWAQSYERDLRDVLALQGTLANAIADEIRVQVAPAEQARLNATRAVSVTTLDNYLEGNYHLHRMGRGFGDEETRMAGEYFRRAIDEDPGFAPAYIGLAYAHGLNRAAPTLLRPSPQDHDIGKTAADRASELDPGSPEVHELLADLDCDDWKWSEAEVELRRAISLNPNRAESHDALGYFLIALGRPDQGVQELQRAQELDPNNDHLANFYFYQGKYEDSIRLSLRDLERQPDDGFGHYGLFQTYALAGRYAEAMGELEETLKLYGFTALVAPLDNTFRRRGFQAAMRLQAAVLENLQKQGKIYMPGTLAEMDSLIGDRDRAFYWLEDAYRHKYSLGADGGLLWLKGNPFYEPLRSDPRFADLVRRVGLPD
ncbi:MAG TPA: winged helix-turn-helix domain-containing protein [Terriglobales bacterium]|nr:winged helix-turn-helix domain-containing protein [Terriglobales bacterium]